MSTYTIGINIKLGTEDTELGIDASAFRAFHTFSLQGSAADTPRISTHELMRELSKLALTPSPVAMDLFVIACAMYAADTSIRRYDNAQDSWTRRLHLFIPVSDAALWGGQTELLTSIFTFLTGDLWEITFRKTSYSIQLPTVRKKAPLAYQTNTVCLFSGGMDSFLGAYKLLAEGVRPLLVGHAKSADVSSFRNSAYKSLAQKFENAPPTLVQAFVRTQKPKSGEQRLPKENTERGRSFMFLTLGALCASALQGTEEGARKRLVVPENGLISLNIPLTPLRLGAYSTRTTHPHLLYLMQQLLDGLSFGVDIDNPFELYTKGEMLSKSGAAEFIADVNTMSCSRPATRNANREGKGYKHCGRCVPCIIRRAALKKANVNDSNSGNYRFDILKNPVNASKVNGENVMAFKYFIRKMRHKPNFLTASIRLTGPLQNIDQYLEMYARGLQEVEDFIKDVKVID